MKTLKSNRQTVRKTAQKTSRKTAQKTSRKTSGKTVRNSSGKTVRNFFGKTVRNSFGVRKTSSPERFVKSKPGCQVCEKCKPDMAAKYSKRPAPSCHADDCRNMFKEGNDGRIYISKPDKRGIYKWILTTHNDEAYAAPKNNTYYTHDNGGRPFKVIITKGGKHIDIYKCNYADLRAPAKYHNAVYYEFVLGFDVLRVMLGDDPDNSFKNKPEWVRKCIGNSILAEISHGKYLYIGDTVFTFNTNGKSPITKYISPVGNSDVPYPYALDSEFAYLMIENVKIPLFALDMQQKPFYPYTQYYDYRYYETIDIKLHGAKVHSGKLDKTELIARLY